MTTLLIAAGVSLVLTGAFVKLASRFGWGKSIRASGPASHLIKAGTPTMGGSAFLVAAAAVWLLFSDRAGPELAVLLLTLAAGLFGLQDDIASLRRKSSAALAAAEGREVEASTGILARYRILAQTLMAAAFSYWAVSAGHALTGVFALDLLFYVFVIVGSINAFNFTDGLDGLAGGITVIVLLFFLGSPLAAALIGALLGFLWYNSQPARVYMGGVGSEALGAAVAGLAIISGTVLYLPLLALIPVLEVLSVVVQVTYFKLTGGRRLLKMSPLHHHFELSGWSETRVVQRFWIVGAVCLAAAIALRGVGL
ncbi:MAG: hypothetical protein KF813_11365 [Trueperaceae bacterium]|nr:hypothetical protein [Trueperaceae bacterium]